MKDKSSHYREYPTIDPNRFDLIVYGSGLPESIIAVATSAAGKTVLHLDPNPFYDSHFASLPLPPFSFLQFTPPLPSERSADGSAASFPYHSVDLECRCVYSEVEIADSPMPESSERCMVDLSGPRVFYCADMAVDLMLRSGASHHVEFKSVEGSMVYWETMLGAGLEADHVPQSESFPCGEEPDDEFFEAGAGPHCIGDGKVKGLLGYS